MEYNKFSKAVTQDPTQTRRSSHVARNWIDGERF